MANDKRVVTKKRAVKKAPQRKPLPPHIDALYKAVEGYVKANGGSILVIGGISIQEWPQDNKYIFHVAVQCCGERPTLLARKATRK